MCGLQTVCSVRFLVRTITLTGVSRISDTWDMGIQAKQHRAVSPAAQFDGDVKKNIVAVLE